VEGFGHPIVFGVVSIIASFGRGLVFYIPLLVLALSRPRTRAAEWSWCLALFVVALIPVYAKWWAWYGGFTFGPRFFLLGAIPGAWAGAELLCEREGLRPGRRMAVVALTWLSCWVAIAGVVWHITPLTAYRCQVDGYAAEPMCWYSPEYSTLLVPLWESHDFTAADLLFIVGAVAMTLAVTLPHLRHAAAAFRPWITSWLQPSPP
jgi:hypothetical protein